MDAFFKLIAARLAQFVHQGSERVDRDRVQPGERLVEHEQIRVVHQGDRDLTR